MFFKFGLGTGLLAGLVYTYSRGYGKAHLDDYFIYQTIFLLARLTGLSIPTPERNKN